MAGGEAHWGWHCCVPLARMAAASSSVVGEALSLTYAAVTALLTHAAGCLDLQRRSC